MFFSADTHRLITAKRRSGGGPLRLARLEVVRDLAEIEGEWRRFETTAEGHIFQRLAFVRAWLASIGAGRAVEPLILVGRDNHEGLICILPFAVGRRRGLRVVEWIGGEHADYHGGLYAPAFLATLVEKNTARRFTAVIAKVLAADADLVHFRRQPATIGGLPNPFARYRALAHADRSHQTGLGADWEAYYRGKRDANSRRHDQSGIENLEAIGPVRFIDAVTPPEIERVMASLFADKERDLDRRGAPTFFADAAVRRLYLELARLPYPRGYAHVCALEVGGKIVASTLGLVCGNRYYDVMHAVCQASPAARFSPGRHLMHHVMQWCIARRIGVFGFAVGNEDVNAQWCEESLDLCASVAALSMRAIPAATALRATLLARRLVKGNTRLRALAERLRRPAAGADARPVSGEAPAL
jgi:CelD/BcsL family acetyltransferase involved in cellulose biosynthesis